jgi:hypothetical protein
MIAADTDHSGAALAARAEDAYAAASGRPRRLTGERIVVAMATAPLPGQNASEIAIAARLAASTVRHWLPLLAEQRLVREAGRFGWWVLTPEGRSCAPVAARLLWALPTLTAAPAANQGPVHGPENPGAPEVGDSKSA